MIHASFRKFLTDDFVSLTCCYFYTSSAACRNDGLDKDGNIHWRDLSRTKYRLTKGDLQLDASYASHIPHHVSECFTEVVDCIYFILLFLILFGFSRVCNCYDISHNFPLSPLTSVMLSLSSTVRTLILLLRSLEFDIFFTLNSTETSLEK